jgi:hypothetical protein
MVPSAIFVLCSETERISYVRRANMRWKAGRKEFPLPKERNSSPWLEGVGDGQHGRRNNPGDHK